MDFRLEPSTLPLAAPLSLQLVQTPPGTTRSLLCSTPEALQSPEVLELPHWPLLTQSVPCGTADCAFVAQAHILLTPHSENTLSSATTLSSHSENSHRLSSSGNTPQDCQESPTSHRNKAGRRFPTPTRAALLKKGKAVLSKTSQLTCCSFSRL